MGTAATAHRTRLTAPVPIMLPAFDIDRLGRAQLRARLIQSDPLPTPPTSGWGWKCETCGSADNGFAEAHAAAEAADYHARQGG